MGETPLFEEKTGLEKLYRLRQLETPDRSVKWYKDSMRRLGMNITSANAALGSDLGTMTGKVLPGDMYLFLYDPKTKDSLPYYDTAPLVLPFRSAKGGFYGLNMHYLPPMMRVQLLEALMTFSTNPQLNETTRLRLRWGLINDASKFPGVEICTKRYLYSHVKSRFLRINPTDWKKTILLPIENFVKATSQKVHSDGRRSK